jgi:UDP-glucose 4,6-dehydratase
MNKKNVLVTGGAGFIASHFIIHLVKKYPNYTVINLDKLGYSSSTKLTKEIEHYKNYTFIKGNILNHDLLTLVLENFAIDHVVHFASETHVDNSFEQSIAFTKNNVLGTHVLIEACRNYGKLKKFVHISTDEVYGESAYGDIGAIEAISILQPTNPYSASKAAAEQLISGYIKSFQFPALITRSNNIFGPHQFPEKVIPKWICLLEHNKTIPVHGDGSNIRAFLYVSDVVNAYDIVLEKGLIGNIYNISSDIEMSNLDLAKTLVRVWKKDEKDTIVYVRDRNINDKRYHVNDDKIRNLGWTPQISFMDGLKETIAWYKTNDPKDIWEHYNEKFLDAHPKK